MLDSILNLILSLLAAPLAFGLINRTKAMVAGRKGQSLFQLYWDLWKLLHKGAVYSKTTTWIFKAVSIVSLAVLFTISLIAPFGKWPALISFQGDFLVLIYLLGLLRFFMVIGALDTGSSFEGMGASREVTFSLFGEVAFLLGLAGIAWKSGTLSMTQFFPMITSELWKTEGAVLGLVSASLFIVLLAENARIPVDDPNTHLELTMIHEVMILDHSGPDLALLLYASALKFWIFGTFVVNIVVPLHDGTAGMHRMAFLIGMAVLSILTGLVESSMARLRLLHVPNLLVAAGVLSVAGLVFSFR